MGIAVSGDGLNVFTSGFPARGMLNYLVDLRPNDSFVIFYTKPCFNPLLQHYFSNLHSKKKCSGNLSGRKPIENNVE